jgi:serine/threonine-protein kinase RsbT
VADTLPIRTSEDIVIVRTAVRKAALAAKLGLVDQTKLVTAASEIARNTLDYGKGGQVTIERVQALKSGIRLTFEDKGPGIPNIELALTDGWTSGTGMGLGLSGTRRLMDEFHLASKAGEGTTVTITKWSR